MAVFKDYYSDRYGRLQDGFWEESRKDVAKLFELNCNLANVSLAGVTYEMKVFGLDTRPALFP
jgi:hypothetical protein